MANGNSNLRPKMDPIFDLKPPLLFAHRGGAGEVPESTREAFLHAVACKTDVLELDVSLTANGQMVVWHGPGLEKARAKDGTTFGKHDYIGNFHWDDLRDNVYVLQPPEKPGGEPKFDPKPDRRLLTLSDFFDLVREIEAEMKDNSRKLHLNIELKKSKGDAPHWRKRGYLERFLKMMDEQADDRKIILASSGHKNVKALRKRIKKHRHYPTGLSWFEQMAYSEYMEDGDVRDLAFWIDPLVREKNDLSPYAFETTHAVCGADLVKEVHDKDGSIYVFLTGLGKLPGTNLRPAPGIDQKDKGKLRPLLFELLNTGVDGIMTDFPDKVGKLLEEWKEENG